MAAQKTAMTIGEFEQYILLPENVDRRFELIDGEVVEMAPGRTWNSGVGHILTHKVFSFCEAHDLPCCISGGDGDYDVQGNIVCPDFAYKPTPLSKEYPDPDPPLWAVEVISPTDKAADIRKKREIYQHASILLWEMYPQSQKIDVYAPGKPLKTLGINDTLDGRGGACCASLLPGFTLAAHDLFAEK